VNRKSDCIWLGTPSASRMCGGGREEKRERWKEKGLEGGGFTIQGTDLFKIIKEKKKSKNDT